MDNTEKKKQPWVEKSNKKQLLLINVLLLPVRKLNNAPARQKKMQLSSQNHRHCCIMNNKFINYKLKKPQKNKTNVFLSESITEVHLYTV